MIKIIIKLATKEEIKLKEIHHEQNLLFAN